MYKRFQTGIRVGSLSPQYFTQYFSSIGGVQRKRTQYIKFNGYTITVECPSFKFTGYENIPSLGCGKNYAHVGFEQDVAFPVFNHDFSLYYWEKKTFKNRLYFNELEFVCNPVTNMVSVDFEFSKIIQFEDSDVWLVI